MFGAAPAEVCAQGFDILLHRGDEPGSEVAATLDLGPVAFSLTHRESLGFLNPAPQDEADSLQRRSRLVGSARFEFDGGFSLPADFDLSLGEWSSGRYDLNLTARNGLRLPGVALEHRLALSSGFASGDSEALQGSGRLGLAFDRFGGRQEAVVEYDAVQFGQVTAVHLNTDWRLDGGPAVTMNLSHHLAEGLSEARFGLSQEAGIFDMTADFAADSTGIYGIGVKFVLRFGAPTEAATWSLANLLAGRQ